MKALIPLAIGLALVACRNNPSESTDSQNPQNPTEEAAPKAQTVEFRISGMT